MNALAFQADPSCHTSSPENNNMVAKVEHDFLFILSDYGDSWESIH